jgi:glycosyltransferase involved in cell wall biosynthesis
LAGGNVEFPGRLSDIELRNLLGRAKVYVQPSYTEGFGLAVVEAMSAGCVPVVTASGALGEVVGEAGYSVQYGNVEEIAAAIRRALESPTGIGPRERVEERFTLDQRATELRGSIMELWRKTANPPRFPARGSGQGTT